MHNQECHVIPIAHNAIGQIQVCQGCQQVTLNLQFLSMKFEAAAFDALVALINHAQSQRQSLSLHSEAISAKFVNNERPH